MKNFIKLNKLKFINKCKDSKNKDKKLQSNPSRKSKNNFEKVQTEKHSFNISNLEVHNISSKNDQEIHDKNKLILLQRLVLSLGEEVFAGTYIKRRKETQKIFYTILKDVNIENLNKMSRKQKFISYTRIKIGIKILICEKNIRDLLEDGKAEDVCEILKESSKLTSFLFDYLLK